MRTYEFDDETKHLCNLIDCPKEDGEGIGCNNCPAKNHKVTTISEAIEIMEAWKNEG